MSARKTDFLGLFIACYMLVLPRPAARRDACHEHPFTTRREPLSEKTSSTVADTNSDSTRDLSNPMEVPRVSSVFTPNDEIGNEERWPFLQGWISLWGIV